MKKQLFLRIRPLRTYTLTKVSLAQRWLLATKLRRGLASFLLLAILVTPFAWYTFRPQAAKAAWFDESYTYRKAIPITNSGSALTDYQISFTLDTATLITAGKMQSDCDDIRITDQTGDLLPFWIEEGSAPCNNAATKIWTKLASLPASTSNLYVYYGNPSATTYYGAQGKLVFDFFDDFDSGSLDPSVWSATGAASVSGGALTTTTGAVYTNNTILADAQGYVYEYRNEWTATTGTYGGLNIADSQTTTGGNAGSDKVVYYTVTNAATYVVQAFAATGATASYNITSGTTQYTSAASTYGVDGFSMTGTNVAYAHNGTQTNSYAGTWSAAPYLWLGYPLGAGSGVNPLHPMTTDWVRVRKYAASVPTVGSLGTEENSQGPVAWWKLDDNSGQTLADSTNNANNGVLGATSSTETTDPAWQPSSMCISGSCLWFDGVDDKATMSTLPANVAAPYSVSVWFKPQKLGVLQDLVSLRGVNSYPRFVINSNNKLLAYAGGDKYLYGTKVFTNADLNQWHHAVFVVASSTTMTGWKVYLDGVDDSGAVSGNTGTYFNPSTTGYLGSAAASEYFQGFLDDVKVYNYTRSADQVKADYLATGSRNGSAFNGGGQSLNPISNGLVGYWPMNETSWTVDCSTATTTDYSGAGSPGKSCPSSTGPTTASGKFGRAGNFDGTNDYVSVTNSTGLKTATTSGAVSVWVWKSLSDSTFRTVYDLNGTGVNGFAIFGDSVTNCTNGYLDVLYGDGVTTHHLCSAISTGAWHHIAVTWSSTQGVFLYLDGALVDSNTSSMPSISVGTTSYIGSNQGTVRFLNGKVDDLRVYNRFLSTDEVTALYTWAPSPVGYWNFDEGSGSTALDRSPYGSGGTWAGTGTHYAPGRFGTGGQFNGSDDTVTVSDPADGHLDFGTSSFSYGLWVDPASSLNSYDMAINKGGNSAATAGYEMELGTSGWVGYISDGTTIKSATMTTETNGQWSYLMMVVDRDANKLYAYLNGNQVASTDITGLGSVDTANALVFSHTSNKFNGLIDDVRIYNYARSPGQITQDFNLDKPLGSSTLGGGTANDNARPGTPALYYDFNEGQGTAVVNKGSAGSAMNGTLTNMASPATASSGWQSTGKFGKDLQFDGSNDEVDVAANTVLDSKTQLTISAWVQFADINRADTNTDTIFNKGAENSSQHAWWMVDFRSSGTVHKNQMWFDMGNGTSAVQVFSPVMTWQASTWYYLAVTFNDATGVVNFYRDGVQYPGLTTFTPNTLNTGTSAIKIGQYATSGHDHKGPIDDLKVYSSELSANDIKADYNRGVAIQAGGNNTFGEEGDGGNPPSALWKFEDASGS